MDSRNNLMSKNRADIGRAINVNDLINRAKLEAKKEKRHTIHTAVAAFSLIIITGFILALLN